MKYLAILLLAVSMPVSANLNADLQAAAGSNAQVRYTLNGNVVTLNGYVEDYYARNQVARKARELGYDVVNNLLTR